jgi:catechol 2,3-dioxygenase-like lactoylglutathione lyase family enzyme
MEMRLEVVVVPVSDVDRAKDFYVGLGWRLDADFVADDGLRVIQLTPPGSPCSVIFGSEVTTATTVHRRASSFTTSAGCSTTAATKAACLGRIRSAPATRRSPRSPTPTETAGCSKK